MSKLIVIIRTCKRPQCGHQWIQRTKAEKPAVCAKCHSYEWDKRPRKKKVEVVK